MSDQGPVVLSGRYELHRRIARGGMAEVFLARDQLLERPVAVKILVPEFATDESFVERFRREAQAAANLNHPNVVGVYDWGKEAGTSYIVMEFVDGRSLADILKAEGTLHPDRAADIATDVAAALGFAHRNGVVHRDVKPGNVLISKHGVVKVTDFGIARAISAGVDQNLTQTGSVMGTATYFSPEQAQGKGVDPRSDLYSLGVVMYEMVCGKPPFQGDSPVAIAYKHVQEAPPPIREINPAVPASYEAIAMKLLAKNPANRYPSAEDLRTDLRRFREGRAVQAESVMAAPVGATTAMAAGGATRALPTQGPPPGGGRNPVGAADRQFDEPPRRRSGAFILAAVLLLAGLAAGLYFFAKSLGVDKASGDKLIDVSKLSVDVARTRLGNAGYTVNPQTTLEYSDTIGKDLVIRTNPAAGTRVDKSQQITLVVSAGKRIVIPTNIVGADQDAAKQALIAAGVDSSQIVIQQQKSDTVDAGKVISVSPNEGGTPDPGTNVTLVVSTGSATPVPDVSGLDITSASQALQAQGFLVAGYQQQYSATVPSGQVIGTNPPKGSTQKKGTAITIIVSKGTEPTTTTSSTTTSSTTTSTTMHSSTTSTTVH
jgi:beta-lactam-binding protein with PASTA domain/predicted Ser/Thr protein kinase